MLTRVKPIQNIIVGAGLGGLATAIALRRAGHYVTVLEGAKELSDVGAGIQVPPNSSRILDAWGLLEKIKTKAVWPSNINIKRYSTGELIGCTPLKHNVLERYGYPYLLIHRADYQRILYDAAINLGAKVILNARVESVDDNSTSVRLVDGTIYRADVIIGADGIRSNVRLAVMPGEIVHPKKSTHCAYRAIVSSKIMREDPDIAHLMDNVDANCWIGYRRHIMAYPMSNGNQYNLVIIHPGEAALGKWNEPGDLEEMKHHYRTFDPIIQKVLTKITSCLNWTLADLPMLSDWVSPRGKITLVGDAAHAMLPYLAQGAAQAIEDGACLGILFSQLESTDQIPGMLKLYEKIRKPRAEIIQKGSAELGDMWHLPDGDNQIARDLAMRPDIESSKCLNKNPNRWSDPDFQPWLFGYDVTTVAKNILAEYFDYKEHIELKAKL